MFIDVEYILTHEIKIVFVNVSYEHIVTRNLSATEVEAPRITKRVIIVMQNVSAFE